MKKIRKKDGTFPLKPPTGRVELVNHCTKDVKRKEIPVISWYRIKTVRVVD